MAHTPTIGQAGAEKSARVAPIEMRLERLDDTKDKLRKLFKRWDNRFVVEKLSIGKEYVSGRLSVAVYFHARGIIDSAKGATGINGSSKALKNVIVLVFQIDAGQTGGHEGGDQEAVFVDVVDFPESPKRKCSSLVRLYRVNDDIDKIGSGFLYQGVPALLSCGRVCFKGGYKRVPSFVHGEGNPTIIASSVANNLTREVIESGPQIMHGVTDGKGDAGWHRCERVELEKIVSRVRLGLDVEFAEVRVEERGEMMLDFVDVAVGPLDL